MLFSLQYNQHVQYFISDGIYSHLFVVLLDCGCNSFVDAAGHGNCDTSDINSEVFNKAVELMREREANDYPITDFEDVVSFLKSNGCDSKAIFGCDVTDETTEALVAYLCYCI